MVLEINICEIKKKYHRADFFIRILVNWKVEKQQISNRKVLLITQNLPNYEPIDFYFQCTSFEADKLKKYFEIQNVNAKN